jgi:hypothetical protein
VVRRSKLLLASLIALSAACSGAGETSLGPFARRAPPRALRKPKTAAPSALTAHRFAEVSDVIGPYVGRDGDVSLAAWAEADASGRSLTVSAIDARGVPGPVQRVGKLAPELDLVLVRGFGASSSKLVGQPRFAVVTTRRGEQKTQLQLTALRADGSALWGPTTLAERSARVLWLGFVATGEQPLLLWAEQPSGAKAGEPAAVYAAAVTVDGKSAPPALISSRACVWQAAVAAGKAALASVKAGATGCSSGSVSLELLGEGGKPEKTVEVGGRAALDLDLVGTPDGFVLAWSDREQLEPRAMTALVDAHGALRSPPGAAVGSLGEQAVLALVAGDTPSTPAFLVWENTNERSDAARLLEISALNAAGRESGIHARLLYARTDGGAPELTAYAGGVAALTLAPACDEDCEGSPPVPTFVALDAGLKLKASEPLLLDALRGRAADLGFGLSCGKANCFALAAPSRTPAALYSVPLPLRENAYRAAAEEVTLPPKPRVAESSVLFGAPALLSHLAVIESPARSLVGYVTDFDPTTPWQKLSKPTEDGRFEPLRARIALHAGTSPAEGQVISLRAHSLGGLTLLPDVSGGNGGLAVWAGLDRGQPQVFLTSFDAAGKRGQQRMLTRKTGATSDVAGLALDTGYLLAWVDERSGDSEVYATRVSRGLEKAGPEQRLTSADGAASDLVLTRVAGRPFAIWADARSSEEPGWADIYGAFLRPNDAARDGRELRLSSTRPHSFSPQVGQLPGGSVVAWIEEVSDGAAASVRIAMLAANGDVDGNVSVVPIEAGAPRGLGIDCGDVSCKLVVTVEAEGRAELYGFEWRPSSTAQASRLAILGEPSAAGVAPIVRGGLVYVADGRDGRGLVRRLRVDW